MAHPHFELPPPPDGRDWCVPCAVFLKTALAAEQASQLKAITAADDDRFAVTVKHRAPRNRELQTAVITGPCAELQQLGPIRVCWDHLAIVGQASPIDTNGGHLPPGLLRGRG